MSAVYGEVIRRLNQQDVYKIHTEDKGKDRVKDGTHVLWKTGQIVIPINKTETQEKI